MRNKILRVGIDASRTYVNSPTGTERYAWEITRRLLALPESKQHNWFIYTKKENFSQFKSLYAGQTNINVVNIGMPYLWTQVGLASRTWVDKLDILWVPAHTLPVLRKPGVKTVVTIHGLEYEWLPAYENPLQRWYLPLSTFYASMTAGKVIAVSKFTKQQIVQRIGVQPEKISVIYEGYTTSPSIPLRNSGEVFRKYGLKPKQFILFVGTIQPRKNLVRLIEAYSKLKTDLRLVIAGKWGWLFDEVRSAPKRFGVENEVVFTGYINDTERSLLLQNALVYVQPSITEGFGLPVLEAMANRVPVVSSFGGALSEVLSFESQNFNKCAGVLFDPNDVEDIGQKLSLVLGDKKLQKQLISLGKERAKDFSWNKSAKKTYSVLIGISETSWG